MMYTLTPPGEYDGSICASAAMWVVVVITVKGSLNEFHSYSTVITFVITKSNCMNGADAI